MKMLDANELEKLAQEYDHINSDEYKMGFQLGYRVAEATTAKNLPIAYWKVEYAIEDEHSVYGLHTVRTNFISKESAVRLAKCLVKEGKSSVSVYKIYISTNDEVIKFN